MESIRIKSLIDNILAFFSGTDMNTLHSEGNDTNCFLSLIVDTKGTYVAAITRKLTIKKKIITQDLGSTYEFFGEGTRTLSSNKETTKIVDETVLQYFMLDIERHEVENDLSYLDDRFDEIIKKKKEAETKLPLSTVFNKDNYDDKGFWGMRNHEIQHELNMFDEKLVDNPDEWLPDSKLIHQAVCRMITCSLIINTDKFDMRQWLTRNINKVYRNIFNSDSQLSEWVQFIAEFCVFHFEDSSAPVSISDDYYYSLISQAMIDELDPYKDNKYVKMYIDELSTFII